VTAQVKQPMPNGRPPNFKWTDAHVLYIREHPHVLGHLAGYDKLTELHSGWIRHIWDTNEHSALQAHRGSYKTTSVNVIGSVWWLLFHPDDRILTIRKTFGDAASVLTTIRSVMAAPEIASLFAYIYGKPPKLVSQASGKMTWDFKRSRTPEGNLNAFGLDSGITGKHGDKVLIDDAVTLKDRVSKAAREATKEALREIYTNIVDPGKPVGHIGTPWHRDDYWSESPVKPLLYPVSKTKLLSPAEIKAKKLTTTPFLYSANYDLEIKANEDMLFRDPVYGAWSWMESKPWAHLDAAFQGTHTCALTIMSRTAAGKIQAIGWTFPGNVKDWIESGFVKTVYKKYGCRGLLNEDNPDKGYTADKLRAQGLYVISYNERQNKTLKISSSLYEAWPDIIWDKDTDPEYLNQVLDWAEGVEPDDAPDSAATLLREKFTTTKKTAGRHFQMAL
jgi:hypothetical protein